MLVRRSVLYILDFWKKKTLFLNGTLGWWRVLEAEFWLCVTSYESVVKNCQVQKLVLTGIISWQNEERSDKCTEKLGSGGRCILMKSHLRSSPGPQWVYLVKHRRRSSLADVGDLGVWTEDIREEETALARVCTQWLIVHKYLYLHTLSSFVPEKGFRASLSEGFPWVCGIGSLAWPSL